MQPDTAPVLQHGCIVFADVRAFEEAGAAFLADGAARNERTLYLDRDETLVRYGDGSLDPRQQVAVWRGALREALSDGHSGLRVVADLTRLVPDDPAGIAALARYEHLVDRFMTTTRGIVGRCGYDASALDPAVLLALASLHGAAEPNPSPMHLTALDADDLLRLAGEVESMITRDSLPIALHAVLPSDGGTLQVDAADLAFIDHRSLRQIDDLLDDAGVDLEVIASRPVLHRMVELVGTRRIAVVGAA